MGRWRDAGRVDNLGSRLRWIRPASKEHALSFLLPRHIVRTRSRQTNPPTTNLPRRATHHPRAGGRRWSKRDAWGLVRVTSSTSSFLPCGKDASPAGCPQTIRHRPRASPGQRRAKDLGARTQSRTGSGRRLAWLPLVLLCGTYCALLMSLTGTWPIGIGRGVPAAVLPLVDPL